MNENNNQTTNNDTVFMNGGIDSKTFAPMYNENNVNIGNNVNKDMLFTAQTEEELRNYIRQMSYSDLFHTREEIMDMAQVAELFAQGGQQEDLKPEDKYRIVQIIKIMDEELARENAPVGKKR